MKLARRPLLALLVPVAVISLLFLGSAPAAPVQPRGFVGAYLPDQTTIAECAQGVTDYTDCWYQAFANLAYAEGVPAAFERLQAEILVNSELNRVCHITTHGIGAGGYLRSKGDLAATVAGGSDLCGGFYHGVMIQALEDIPDGGDAEVAALLIDTCFDTVAFPEYGARTNCMHGAGHALMVRENNNLPEMLRVCDAVEAREMGMGYFCSLGVTMENFISSWGLDRRWLKEGDPMYPCNVIEPQHRAACCGGIGQDHAQLVGNEPDALGKICLEADPAWVAYCLRQAYADLPPAEWEQPAKIVARCEKVAPYARVCLYSAITSLAVRGGGPASIEKAAALCALLPDGPLGEACAYALGGQLNRSGNADIDTDTLCGSFASRPSLAVWCQRRGSLDEEMRDLGIFIDSPTGVFR